MANYKRGYPRTQKRGRHGMAQVSYRKRHGLKPYIIPDGPRRDDFERFEDYWIVSRLTYQRRRQLYWPNQYNMMSGSPRDWDITHHIRPHRRRVAKLVRNIMIGKIDPENAAWPLAHKPRIYYW